MKTIKQPIILILTIFGLTFFSFSCAGGGDNDKDEQCGNGVVDEGEECEPPDEAACNSSCMRNVAKCGDGLCEYPESPETCAFDCHSIDKCGDGTVSGDEECDGADLNGKTCDDLGFNGGDLSCNPANCTFNTSSCISADCGNGVINSNEECDGNNLNGKSCETEGFDTGNLVCNNDCTIDTSQCTMNTCGNNMVEQGEDCDGMNLNGKTCDSLGFAGGNLFCSDTCHFDTSQCNNSDCGNLIIDSGEDCDGGNLNSKNCITLGFDGGTLSCSSSCEFDTSSCTTQNCGNGNIDSGEDCDSNNLGGASCISLGYSGGTLVCNNSNCTFDTSGCTNTGSCGDSNVDPGEDCDSANLDGKTCELLGYSWGGELSCSSTCDFNESQCHNSCYSDSEEPNDGSTSAIELTPNVTYLQNLTICINDVDWFKFYRDASNNYRIEVLFEGKLGGDLDVEIYDATYIAGAYANNDVSGVDNEIFDMPTSFHSSISGYYSIRVYGEGEPPSQNDSNIYAIRVVTY